MSKSNTDIKTITAMIFVILGFIVGIISLMSTINVIVSYNWSQGILNFVETILIPIGFFAASVASVAIGLYLSKN